MDKNLGIKWYQTLDSTNSQAARELDQAPEGTVWIADFQSAGRGQRGNRWESKAAENLTFSILFRPVFLSPAQQFKISQAVSLGVQRYLCGKGLDAKIKWPNDIYIGNKKICGMLIEHSISGDKLAGSIVGIGLNLNQREFSPIAPNPTSLILEMVPQGGEYNRREELAQLLGYICTAYGELEEGYAEELDAEYTGKLYRLGEFHKFIETDTDTPADIPVEKMKEGKMITAKITGVDQYGCLELEFPHGEKKPYPFKGIKYVI